MRAARGKASEIAQRHPRPATRKKTSELTVRNVVYKNIIIHARNTARQITLQASGKNSVAVLRWSLAMPVGETAATAEVVMVAVASKRAAVPVDDGDPVWKACVDSVEMGRLHAAGMVDLSC
ncbi:MAG: hypothetical protein M1837_000246 [Sclerophora amabilis]|nr:MAG: hypothetical protein M1837_000246 [Sclerophora amabilis]